MESNRDEWDVQFHHVCRSCDRTLTEEETILKSKYIKFPWHRKHQYNFSKIEGDETLSHLSKYISSASLFSIGPDFSNFSKAYALSVLSNQWIERLNEIQRQNDWSSPLDTSIIYVSSRSICFHYVLSERMHYASQNYSWTYEKVSNLSMKCHLVYLVAKHHYSHTVKYSDFTMVNTDQLSLTTTSQATR